MLNLLAKPNPYLGIPEPDMMLVYGLGATTVAIGVAMLFFRGIAKWRESRQVQKSSWRTFHKIAKVKGLSKLEISTLALVVGQSRVGRPSQVLGTIQLFDRCVDQAVDRETISDAEQGVLERVREKLIRTTTKWDGRTNRRQFERADCGFEIQMSIVTKDALDEELKSSYDEEDPKFRNALEMLATQALPVGARLVDLSAGGVSLLIPDKDPVKPGNYARLSAHDPLPFEIEGMVGKVLASERMEDQRQLVLHASFIPYEQEVRRQIIQLVYSSGEGAGKGSEPAKGAAAAKSGPGKAAAGKAKAKAAAAKAKVQKGEGKASGGEQQKIESPEQAAPSRPLASSDTASSQPADDG